MISLQQILNALNSLAPWDLAESWDHVGLQIGAKNRTVQRVLVAVDLNREVLEEGLRFKVDGFIVHHPLLFKPVFQVNPEIATGFYLASLIKNDLFLIAAHTNLDKAAQGLNRYLADILGLKERDTIETAISEECKIIVFIPESHLTTVREAMAQAGAGIIGNYSECSFEIRGNGTFRPNSEARPYLGEVNQFETVAEIRLEMIAEQRNLAKVLKAISESHPYEEPAIDIYPLLNSSRHGLGCIGSLDPGIAFEDLCRIVQNKLKAKTLRVLGESRKLIKRLAICTGSGHDILPQVIRQGADAYLTGELDYHDYQAAEGSGLTIIEAGHWTTECCFMPLVTDYLKKAFASIPDFTVIPAVSIEAEPYRTLT